MTDILNVSNSPSGRDPNWAVIHEIDANPPVPNWGKKALPVQLYSCIRNPMAYGISSTPVLPKRLGPQAFRQAPIFRNSQILSAGRLRPQRIHIWAPHSSARAADPTARGGARTSGDPELNMTDGEPS